MSKHLATLALSTWFCLVGCGNGVGASTTLYSENDFEPPVGSASAPAGVADNGGNWSRRLLTATSTDDGLTWTKTNAVISDQADAQSIVADDVGRLYCYFVTNHEDHRDETVVAISYDQGSSWVFKTLTFTGLATGARPPVDPAVVRLDDGRFRMYFSSNMAGAVPYVSTFSALSSDGLNFTLESGVRDSRSDRSVVAPAIVPADGGVLNLFAIVHGGTNSHATATDGLNFTVQPDMTFADSEGSYFVSDGIAVTGGYRAFLFQGHYHANSHLRSAFSADGVSWSLESGHRLELDTSTGVEAETVRGGRVVRRLDGSLLMVYVSEIP